MSQSTQEWTQTNCGRHHKHSVKADHIPSRLSSLNFTWSILGYFVPNTALNDADSCSCKTEVPAINCCSHSLETFMENYQCDI